MPFFSRCSRRTPDNLSSSRVCIEALLTDALCEIIEIVLSFFVLTKFNTFCGFSYFFISLILCGGGGVMSVVSFQK